MTRAPFDARRHEWEGEGPPEPRPGDSRPRRCVLLRRALPGLPRGKLTADCRRFVECEGSSSAGGGSAGASPSRFNRRPRSGVALVIVIVLIGLFGALCQALTLLAAMQHRQAFHQAGQAQARRLAEAGLRRAAAQIERDAQWSGETWKPMLPGGETATVLLRVNRRQADRVVLEAEASFETGRGRIHKVNQSLDAAATSARALKEVSQP